MVTNSWKDKGDDAVTNNRYCSHCGYERAERERFCAKCGIPFADMDYELGLPFDLPSVAFASELDEEEQLCVERESSYFDKSVMRGSEVDPKIRTGG